MNNYHALVYANKKEVWAKNLRQAVNDTKARESEIAAANKRAAEHGLPEMSESTIAEIKAAGELQIAEIFGAEPTFEQVVAKLEADAAAIQAANEAE